MSMHFPYSNQNIVGQHLYGTAVCPNFGVNNNHYFAPFYPNSNGLSPTSSRTVIEQNKNFNIQQYKPLIHKNSLPFISHNTINNIDKNNFLSFIEQKPKSISELNPFANEFSVIKDHNNNQIITKNNENNSSYRLIFDQLIEQSLQSIEAIKKASKTVSVNHIATQYNQSIDQINRSTQTNYNNDQYNLLEQYSSHTVKLMDKLFENFQNLLLSSSNNNNTYNELKSISFIFDELHHLILIINQIILLNKSSINKNYLFSNMIEEFSIQSSLISSRHIHPITNIRSKICLLCQKPVDDGDDVMHKLCRLLSSPPNTSIDIQNLKHFV